MNTLIRSAFCLLIASLGTFSLSGCERAGKPEQLFEQRFLAFGTLVEVSIFSPEREQADAAIAAIRADFQYLHETWHPWEPGSLNRVNRLIETGTEFTLGPGFAERIQEATQLSRASGGLFNPAIGKLIELWGFNNDELKNHSPPSDDKIKALVVQDPQLSDLRIDGIRALSLNPAVWLDFGAYLKGYALDEAIKKLRTVGIDNAIVNAGGNLRAYGRHGDRPWSIGIRDPQGPNVLASVEIDGDEAVVTSGDYERYFEHEGQRYHHIIDPRTGYPARGLRSATVIHASAAVADAASTALFVAGIKDSIAIARAIDVDQIMLVDETGTVYLSPKMMKRIKFVGNAPEIVELN